MKKIVVALLVLLVIAVVVCFVAPSVFRERVERALVGYVTKGLAAKVEYEELDLSFARSFPRVRVSLRGLTVTGLDAWAGDTLARVGEGWLELNLRGVLKGRYAVEGLALSEGEVRLKVTETGNRNWDVVREKSATEGEGGDMRVTMEGVEVRELALTYEDRRDGTAVSVGRMDGMLSGAWSEKMADADAKLSMRDCEVKAGAVTWLNDGEVDVKVKARAERERYELEDSYVRVNGLKVGIAGSMVKAEEGWQTSVKMNTEGVGLKELMSMVPGVYANDFDALKADGKVRLTGEAEGLFIPEKDVLPRWSVTAEVADGWFMYEGLPKRAEDVAAWVSVSGGGRNGGKMDLEVKRARLRMGGNRFEGGLSIREAGGRRQVAVELKGKVNLAELKDYVPVEDEMSGLAEVDLRAKGDYKDYERGAFDGFALDGMAEMRNCAFGDRKDGKGVHVDEARVVTSGGKVRVEELRMRLGESDMEAEGRVENLLEWMLRGRTLKGELRAETDHLQVMDLVRWSDEEGDEAEEDKKDGVVQLPQDLDVRMTWRLGTVEYENIRIEGAVGSFHLKEGELKWSDVELRSMGGKATTEGEYRAMSDERAEMKGKMTVRDVLYKEAFRQVESARSLLPIFGKTEGRMSASFDFDVPLGEGMKPNVNALTARGGMESHGLTISGVEALHRLSKVTGRSELYDPEIKEVKIPFNIEKGEVRTSGFAFEIADTRVKVDEGRTGLDEKIDYMLHVDVPTSESTVFKMSKMGVHIGGTFTKPEVSVRSRDMIVEAKETMKRNVAKTTEVVKEEAREEWREQKDEMKENAREGAREVKESLREAGKEIKNTWRRILNNE
ncbi:MAG: AsmA-like C-terminal region-containing protein [Paludibacteraceae bacterium]|nr:AsmA-like C-terminal region-containing protein [Paludibacteraceae bacterium]